MFKPLPDQAAVYRSEGMKRWAVDRLATAVIAGFLAHFRPTNHGGLRSARYQHSVSDSLYLLHVRRLVPCFACLNTLFRGAQYSKFSVIQRMHTEAFEADLRGDEENSCLERVLLDDDFLGRKNVTNAILKMYLSETNKSVF